MYVHVDKTTATIDEATSSFFELSEVRLYVVLGLIIALILIAILQAGCTIYKTSRNRQNQKVNKYF